ncbi:hypothetical protein VTO73DRAFT_6262 [Trametes versicolor]
MDHSSRSPTPPDASSDAATSDDVDYESNAPDPSFTSLRDRLNESDVSMTSDYDRSVSPDRPPSGSLRYGRARSAPVGLPSAPVGLPSAPDVGTTSRSLSAALFSSFKSTPLRHSTSSTLSQDHLRGMVHKALYRNLVNHTKKVTSEQWVEGVLGLDTVAFAKLHTAIHDAGWAQDQLIVDALQEITKAQKEIETYDPYCKIINYIMAHAEDLTGYTPATDHLGNLCFRPHNLQGVVKGKQEEVNAAQRFPDIAALTDSTNETHWYMLPLTCELKYTAKPDDSAQRRRDSVSTEASSEGRGSADLPISWGSEDVMDSPAVSSGSQGITVAGNLDSPASGDLRRKRKGKGTASGPARPKKTKLRGEGLAMFAIEREVYVQAASNALEMLAYSYGARLSCINLTVWDDKFGLWYYDPCGIVCSDEPTSFSFFGDFARAAAVFVVLKSLCALQWGAIPGFKPPGDASSSFPVRDMTGYTVDVGGGRTVCFGKNLYSQYELFGRRSVVYEASLVSVKNDEENKLAVAVKVAYQASGRVAEYELLKTAHEKGVPHIPKMHAHRDLYALSELQGGVRQRLRKLYPDLFTDVEDRIARLIAFDKYLPLKDRLIEHPEDIIAMVDQITDALHALRYKALILHRDVSNTNIMWEKKNGQVHFILNDFDLAIRLNRDGTPAMEATAKHRTGTLPFMSISLLEDTRPNPNSTGVMHELHHDYESLFWVATWCTMKTERDILPELKEQIQTAVTKWETGDHEEIAMHKERIIFGNKLKNLPMTPRFERLRPVLRVFRKVFKEANEAIVDDDFGRSGAEILREWITRSKIKDIMGKAKVKASVGIAG